MVLMSSEAGEEGSRQRWHRAENVERDLDSTFRRTRDEGGRNGADEVAFKVKSTRYIR